MRHAMLAGLFLAAACSTDTLDLAPTAAVAVAGLGTGANPLWNPHSPFTEQQLHQLCNNPEQELTRPPDPAGYCDVEIRLASTRFASGQGATEGHGEISFVAGANPTDAPDSATVADSVGEQEYNVGQSMDQGMDLGTFRVQLGQSRTVELCLYFTEHDNGGSNGGDDTAWGCSMVTLRCRATDANGDGQADGAASQSPTLGPFDFCGDNTCLGSMTAQIQIMAADADMDDVPNDEDFTPELCDEERKGEEGIGGLFYYHYDDKGFAGLVQAVGVNLAPAYSQYDRVALVADNATSNPMNINAAMFSGADRVFPPTREGLLDAMQYLTSEGMRWDMFAFSHGEKVDDPDDSMFYVLEGHSITGNWLELATDPGAIGTARHGVPLMAWWSTTCIAARQIDSWIEIGGRAASGAVETLFYPNAWQNFSQAWFAGDPYRQAVDDSVTTGVVGMAEWAVVQQGAGKPWSCTTDDPSTPAPNDGPGIVTDMNACAEAFFNDDVGPIEPAYKIQDVYDHTKTGAENMAISSVREFDGIDALTFGAPGHSWP